MTEFPEAIRFYRGLSEDTQLFKHVFDEVKDAMMLIDKEGHVKEINHSMKTFLSKYYGSTGDNISIFDDELIPDDIKIVLKQLFKPGNSGGEIKIEGRSPTFSNKISRIIPDYDYHAKNVSSEIDDYVLITLRDKKDRNLLEKKLRRRIKHSGLVNELLIKLSGIREVRTALKILADEIVAATDYTCGIVFFKKSGEILKSTGIASGSDFPDIGEDLQEMIGILSDNGKFPLFCGSSLDQNLPSVCRLEKEFALFDLKLNSDLKFVLLFCKPSGLNSSEEDRSIIPTALRSFRMIITRIHAESELKTERLKLDNIFHRSRLGIYITTIRGRFLTMNNALLKMLGYSDMEEINRTVIDIGDQIYVDKEFRRSMIEKIKTEKLDNYTYETPLRRKDGEVFIARVNMSIIKNVDNSAEILQGFVEDITEQRKKERDLKLLNQELERRVSIRTSQLENANKELETFAYSVSHDLRAPLRSIDGFAQALEEDFGTELDNIAIEYLGRIKGAANKMAMIIDDMLKLSRITRSEMKFAPVNISDMANSVIDELRQSSPGRSAEIYIDESIIVSGDINLLRIALDNLLGNAWKFTSKKNKAIIKVTRSNEPHTFTIEDNGAGFDMQYYNKLFNPFQRLHKDDEFEGTGIGLATVKRIISKHGGSIQASSSLNEGTVFTIYLPEKIIQDIRK
ncbi:MAG: sensor histidine kinase [Candidatus Kapaibacterium sp.]